jgi:general secretion pathway protein G
MYKALRKRVQGERESGFTLIELLIVIVILGILAAIVIFAVGSARDDSVKSACKADVKTVNTAAEAYKAKKGSFPTQAQLTAAGADQVMKSYPSSSEYTIAYNATTGVATGDITGGAATTDCSA